MTSPNEPPIDVETSPLESWTITTPPRPGRPAAGPRALIPGFHQAVFSLPRAAGDILESTLRRPDPRDRSQRVRLYRDGREVRPAGGDDGDDLPGIDVSLAATSTDPVELQLAQTRQDVVRLERERDRLDAQIAAAQKELERIRARAEEEAIRGQRQVEAATKKHNEIMTQANEHLFASLARNWEIDTLAQEKRNKALQQHSESLDVIVDVRAKGDALMLKDGIGDAFRAAKDIFSSAADSDWGRALGLMVNGAIASQVAKVTKTGEISTRDAIAAMVIEGKKHRERVAAVRKACATVPKSPVGQGALMALQVVEGGADIQALAEMLLGHEEGR